jgi:hypothetical protein
MKYLLTLIVGALLGGVGAYFLFVGAPGAKTLPGEPLRAPEAGGDPPGTAVLTLDEQFFSTLLDTIFRDLGQPTFKLAGAGGAPAGPDPFGRLGGADGFRVVKAQGGCENRVMLLNEGSGTKTAVQLKGGQILVPLAFSGSYNLGTCLNFRGSAQASLQLSFDQQAQTLYGRLNVEGVNLEGFSPVFSPVVTGFVQNAINQRVNPLVLLRGQQLNLVVPVEATGGSLRAQPRDVRYEATDGALRLHVTYDFGGARAGSPPPPG